MQYRGFGTNKPGGWLANAFDIRDKVRIIMQKQCFTVIAQNQKACASSKLAVAMHLVFEIELKNRGEAACSPTPVLQSSSGLHYQTAVPNLFCSRSQIRRCMSGTASSGRCGRRTGRSCWTLKPWRRWARTTSAACCGQRSPSARTRSSTSPPAASSASAWASVTRKVRHVCCVIYIQEGDCPIFRICKQRLLLTSCKRLLLTSIWQDVHWWLQGSA